jgi:hypothetical protein
MITEAFHAPPIPNLTTVSYLPPGTSLAAMLRPGCCMSGISAVMQTLAPVIALPPWRTVKRKVVPSGRGGLGSEVTSTL